MPKSNVKIEEVQEMVGSILNENGKLIGLCYMDMFKDAGWDEQLKFDCIIDGTLIGVVKK